MLNEKGEIKKETLFQLKGRGEKFTDKTFKGSVSVKMLPVFYKSNRELKNVTDKMVLNILCNICWKKKN